MNKYASYICTNRNHIPLGLIFYLSYIQNSGMEHDFYWFVDDISIADMLKTIPMLKDVKFKVCGKATADNDTHFDDTFFYGMSMKVYALQELYQDYDRIFYFDVDMIIQKDITELLDYDLKGKSLGAVPDIALETWPQLSISHGIISDILTHRDNLIGSFDQYFNSGMMIIDTQKEIEFIDYDEFSRRPVVSLVDQDYLNVVYQDDWTKLPNTFNSMVDITFIEYMSPVKRAVENQMQRASHILHYHGTAKPWRDTNYEVEKSLVAALFTGSFLYYYDIIMPQFEHLEEYSWMVDGVKANRKRLELTDRQAAAFCKGKTFDELHTISRNNKETVA